MRSIGDFKTAFAGPPVNKLDADSRRHGRPMKTPVMKMALDRLRCHRFRVLELLQDDAACRSLPSWCTTKARMRRALSRTPGAEGALVVSDRRAEGIDLVVEAAGHAAIEQHVLPALARGTPCLVASVGALSARACCEKLEDAAVAQGGTQVQLIPGAIGAIDALAAARIGGLESRALHRPQAAACLEGHARRAGPRPRRADQRAVIFEGTRARSRRSCTRRTRTWRPPCRWPAWGSTARRCSSSPTPRCRERAPRRGRGRLRQLRADHAQQAARGQPQDIRADRVQRRARAAQPRGRAGHLTDLFEAGHRSRKNCCPIFIAGEWRLGGGDVYASLYPATGEWWRACARPAWPT
jgi:hypothetical protein